MVELSLEGECHNGQHPVGLVDWHWRFEGRCDDRHYCYYFHGTLRAAEAGEAVIEVGGLRIDTLGRAASFDGEALKLTLREFDLLAFLAHQPGRVFSREELLRKVWGYDYLGETRTVDVHVRRLRVKLGETHRVIETVTGAGYKLASQPASSGG